MAIENVFEVKDNVVGVKPGAPDEKFTLLELCRFVAEKAKEDQLDHHGEYDEIPIVIDEIHRTIFFRNDVTPEHLYKFVMYLFESPQYYHLPEPTVIRSGREDWPLMWDGWKLRKVSWQQWKDGNRSDGELVDFFFKELRYYHCQKAEHQNDD